MIIYQITNILTNDIYIGKTTDPSYRFYRHKYNAKKNKSRAHIHRAMRKYGVENFTFSVLEQVESVNILNEREIYWIAKLKPKYNMTKGGDGGDTSSSPNYKEGIKRRDQSGPKNGMYGRKRPDTVKFLAEAKEKMLEANRCPVSCEGTIFNSVGEAQSAYPGISIRKRLDDERYTEFYRLRPKTKRK
jgi:group I intron endonuclease